MKTTRRTRRTGTKPADKPAPAPSTATDWDLWMEKHARELGLDGKPPARRKRRPARKTR